MDEGARRSDAEAAHVVPHPHLGVRLVILDLEACIGRSGA